MDQGWMQYRPCFFLFRGRKEVGLTRTKSGSTYHVPEKGEITSGIKKKEERQIRKVRSILVREGNIFFSIFADQQTNEKIPKELQHVEKPSNTCREISSIIFSFSSSKFIENSLRGRERESKRLNRKSKDISFFNSNNYICTYVPTYMYITIGILFILH